MKFVIYQDLRGEWRWRLVADNGRVVADSAEGYVDKFGVNRALRSVMDAVQSPMIAVEQPE